MAINAQDIRIGNWLFSEYREEPYKIQMADFRNNEYDVFKRLTPIPLTEEWFYKFGFSPTKAHDGITRYSKNGLHIYGCCEYENGVAVEEFGVKFGELDIAIKSVHQLQNLTYALTGQELTA